MRKLITGFILSFSFFCTTAYSQSRTNVTGGDFIGATGSVSFSVGLVDYININSVNNYITQGIQQPYEIYSLKTEQVLLPIHISVFPNPFVSTLNINIENANIEFPSGELIDISGKTIWKNDLNKGMNQIQFAEQITGTYFFRIYSGAELINTYKIIKL